jgi:hypothetical protein
MTPPRIVAPGATLTAMLVVLVLEALGGTS